MAERPLHPVGSVQEKVAQSVGMIVTVHAPSAGHPDRKREHLLGHADRLGPGRPGRALHCELPVRGADEFGDVRLRSRVRRHAFAGLQRGVLQGHKARQSFDSPTGATTLILQLRGTAAGALGSGPHHVTSCRTKASSASTTQTVRSRRSRRPPRHAADHRLRIDRSTSISTSQAAAPDRGCLTRWQHRWGAGERRRLQPLLFGDEDDDERPDRHSRSACRTRRDAGVRPLRQHERERRRRKGEDQRGASGGRACSSAWSGQRATVPA